MLLLYKYILILSTVFPKKLFFYIKNVKNIVINIKIGIKITPLK